MVSSHPAFWLNELTLKGHQHREVSKAITFMMSWRRPRRKPAPNSSQSAPGRPKRYIFECGGPPGASWRYFLRARCWKLFSRLATGIAAGAKAIICIMFWCCPCRNSFPNASRNTSGRPSLNIRNVWKLFSSHPVDGAA